MTTTMALVGRLALALAVCLAVAVGMGWLWLGVGGMVVYAVWEGAQ